MNKKIQNTKHHKNTLVLIVCEMYLFSEIKELPHILYKEILEEFFVVKSIDSKKWIYISTALLRIIYLKDELPKSSYDDCVRIWNLNSENKAV
jgi:hypothetical protein